MVDLYNIILKIKHKLLHFGIRRGAETKISPLAPKKENEPYQESLEYLILLLRLSGALHLDMKKISGIFGMAE